MAVSISLVITQNSQSVTGNSSNVTVSVKASWTNGSWNAVVTADNVPQANGSCTINGTSYTFRSTFNEKHTTSGSATTFTKTLTILLHLVLKHIHIAELSPHRRLKR